MYFRKFYKFCNKSMDVIELNLYHKYKLSQQAIFKGIKI